MPDVTVSANIDTFLQAANNAAARTALGVAIGTNVQAYDADLAAIAGLTSAADKGIQFTGAGTAATFTLTTAGKAILDDADATAQRATLGLVIGTDVQAFDANLATWAGITPGADVATALAVNVGSAGAFVLGDGVGLGELGSALQVLRTNAGATATEWATPSGGSAYTSMTFVETDFVLSGASTNQFLTGAAFGSGTTAPIAGTANHPGIISILDSTTANAGYRYATEMDAILIAGGETAEFVFQLKSGGVRTTAICRFGYQDQFTNTVPVDGAWLNIVGDGTGATLSGKTRSNSSETTTGTTYTLAVDTWYRAKIEVNSGATSVAFTLFSEAGSQLWTNTCATNIPTGAGRGTGMGITSYETSVDAASTLVWLDWLKFSINRTLVR